MESKEEKIRERGRSKTWWSVEEPFRFFSCLKSDAFRHSPLSGLMTFEISRDRTWVFRMSSSAKEIFLVEIVDDHGDDIDVLADASDVYAGTESGWLNAGTYYLDVAADSPWTVTMSTS
jgi:hypothetical protein